MPGTGTDYQVGLGKTYATLDAVPWENLKAGDSVRIFYSATPYLGKFVVYAQGTAAAPVHICGVRGPNGERPIISGNNAVTRPQLLLRYGNTPYVQDVQETRGIINIMSPSYGMPRSSYINIDGLAIRNAYPNYTFKSAQGVTKNYVPFGACIWVDNGDHITIKDNEISDCQMAVFSKSADGGAFAETRDLVIAGNLFYGNGVVGDEHMHTTYTQGFDTVICGNNYQGLRSGATGNSIKDRSAGLTVCYNRIEEGAHSIDMVEAEDFPIAALAYPAYRKSVVYGNLIIKTGDTGSIIHYGGDHFGAPAGANWGESLFRQGTLYFFNNTVHAKGPTARLFQISTTKETVEAYNNVFWGDATMNGAFYLRQAENDGMSPLYVRSGILNLGKNWFKQGLMDTDVDHPITGTVTGMATQMYGATIPFDSVTYKPLTGSVIIDVTQSGMSAVSGYPVSYQYAPWAPVVRKITGTSLDLGAFEY